MLVGRDREVEAIDAAIERAQRGERAAVMLTGEPGIGKTTLLEQLATRVRALGGKAAWGRCAEVGLTPAFWPWMQLLAALETPDDRAPSLDQFGQFADAASTATDAMRASAPAAITPASAANRLARFEEVMAFIQRRARDSLVALVIDDAHAADLGSLQLLEYVLPRLVGSVVVAVSARDGDATPAVAMALGRVQRAGRRMPLGRLGRDDVGRLVDALSSEGDSSSARDRSLPADTAHRIFELSEGNPLFVEELVESLASQSSSSVQPGSGVQLPAVSSVRAIIRERVERLPVETGALLAAAAILGREFRAAVVADTIGISIGDAIARLDPVLRLGMVSAMSGDRYRFSHALVAEALGDELDPSERARLHLRAAAAIEKRDGTETAAIAHHLLAAGHLAAEAAVVAAERAAAEAMARLGFEDAASLLERACAALVLAAPDDKARRAALECRWAEALQLAGDHVRGAERCDSAARIARDLADPELLARIAIVRGIEYRFGRTDQGLVATLREALSALDRADSARPAATSDATSNVLRAKLLARLAAAEQPAPDPAGPVAEAQRAIELAHGLPDRDRLHVLYTATAALVDYVPSADLERVHREVIALATAVNDRPIIAHTLARLCFTALERIDRAAFEATLVELRGLAAALGIPRWQRTVHLLDALRAQLEGRLGDADRAADLAEAVAGNDADGRWLVDFHRLLSCNGRSQNPGPELREIALGYAPGQGMIACWLASLSGDPTEMRDSLATLGALPTDIEVAMMIGGVIAAFGTDERRRELYERGQSRRGRLLIGSMLGTTISDLHDRTLMNLAASLRRWDDAEAHKTDALSVADRLGSPLWRTRVLADWADILDQRARPGDAKAAAELRRDVLAEAERIGMPGVIARCRAAGPAAPATATALAASRIEIERLGELWSVRGFGEQTMLKDSRGIQMLAQLIGQPGRELHALELSGTGGTIDTGDSGEVLDATARQQYRVRLRELTEERDEAESWGDAARYDKATAEIEALTAELERAVGLGGRERRVGSASERARSNVQRRVNHALQQIRSTCPRLGEHLAATVHTGAYCRYSP